MEERWIGSHPAEPIYLRGLIPYSTKPSFVFRFFFVFQDKTEIFFFVLLPAKLLVFASSLLPFAQYQNSNAEGDYNEQEPKSASLSP